MRSSRHLTTLALAATLLLAACTGRGDPTPTPTLEASPISEATPAPTTRAPFILVTPSPTPEVIPPREVRAVLLDAATGNVTTLYDGPSWLFSDRLTPRFTPDGAAVWISPVDGTGATRYGLDGEVLYELPGAWAVRESDDGFTRTYLTARGDDESRTRIAERGGVRRMIGTEAFEGVPSPDGTRLAFRYRPDPDSELLAIDVVDIPTGDRWTIATDLGPCGCDGGPAPVWSPSGDFIAYIDFESPRGNADDDYGAYIVPAEGGPAIRRSDAGWFTDSWVLNDDGTVSINYSEGSRLLRFDLATGGTTLVYAAPTEENSAVGLLDDHILRVTYPERLADQRTILATLDGVDVTSWPGLAEVVLSPDGPVASVINHGISPSRGDLDCDGIWYDHPLLAEPGCIEQARWGVWSPDASYFVASIELDILEHATIVVNVLTGEHLTLPTTRGPVSSMEWNQQGTHLLLSWGTGL